MSLACAICNSPADFWLTIAHIRTIHCRSCDSVSLCAEQAASDPYDDVYYAQQYLPDRDQRLAFFRRVIGELQLTPGLAVDIGCGAGIALDVLRDSGWSTVGFDTSRAACQVAAAAGHAVAQAFAESSPVRGGVADAVFLFDVLPAVSSPCQAVSDAARLLRPGATLLLKVRHRPSMLYRLARSMPPAVARAVVNAPAQQHSISRLGVRTMLVNAGLEGVGVRRSREAIGLSKRLSNARGRTKAAVVIQALLDIAMRGPSTVAWGHKPAVGSS